MKPTAYIVAATAAMVFAVPAPAQVDCANWNTVPFFKAAKASDVTRCLEAGVDPNLRSGMGFTPLHNVATFGSAEAVMALVKWGADLEARAVNNATPLHFAVALGSAEAVVALLLSGAEPNVYDSNSETPLHRAVSRGSKETVKALVRWGADLEARGVNNATSLHFAAALGNAEAVAVLLEAGADPTARDDDGRTPLDVASDNEAVRVLLVTGTDLAPKEKSRTIIAAPDPAQVDCANWNTAAFFKAARESDVTRCLERGADPNVRERSYHSYTPLHFVATVGNAGAVVALANRGANLEARAGTGETPLHIAAAVENTVAVEALAKQGADVEARGRDGFTPLHRATVHGNEKAVKALLKVGADPNGRDQAGQTPLHFAANLGNAEVVAALIVAGADPNLRDESGTTPLDYVDNESVKALLESAGAVQPPALDACAGWNTKAIYKSADASGVARCLETSADLEMRDERGETPLYKAVMNRNAEEVKALLEAGANPNVRDMICRTPLHWAATFWRPDLGMALLEAGADAAVRDEDGNFPFDEIPPGIGDILRLKAKGARFPGRGEIGGPLQTAFYSKLYQGKFSQVRRLFSPNPIPPACSESGDPLSVPSAPLRNPPHVR